MRGEVARADQRFRGIVEVTVVFAVDEQQIHANRGRNGFERIRETEQYRDSRRTVVRSRHRHALLPQVLTLVRERPGVPVCQEQHTVRRQRAKPREEIAQVQVRALLGRPAEVLHRHRIGAGAQRRQQPVAHLFVRRCIRNAWTKRHLLLHVGERGVAVELASSFCAACPAASSTRLTGG